MNCALSFIELRVANLVTSIAWYRDVLGLEVLMHVEQDGFALLSAGTIRLALKQGLAGPGGVLLAFEVADLPGWLARLAEQRVPLDGPVKASAEGYRRARLRDPDGYAISLFMLHED